MKQPAIEKYEHGIYRTFPLLVWRKCEVCNYEFRREWGWRFLIYKGLWLYVCKECIPDKNRVHSYAKNGEWMPPRPNIAPPAPHGNRPK